MGTVLLSGVGRVVTWLDDDVDDVAVVTDANESLEDDDVSDDAVEVELLDEDEVDELSASLPT